MSSDDLQTTLRNGIDAAKRGDRITARRLLEQVIARDDRNEMAWIWLASVVNTNAERRNALERVLQINPRNSRAREALAKLNETSGTAAADQSRVRDTISRVRESQRLDTTTIAGGGGSNLGGLLLLIGLVAAAVIVGILLLNGFNQNAPEPTTVAVVPTIAATATATFTPSPSPTPENRSAAEVTRINAPTLPPTFTPTEPPPPTEAPTSTPTPIGLENFPMLYTSLNTGAAQADLYSLNADGSNDGFLIEGVRDIAISPDGQQIAFVRDIVGSVAIAPPEEPTATEEPTEQQLPTLADSNSDLGLPEAPTQVAEVPNVQTTSGELAAEVFVASINDLENPRQITTLGAADTASPSFSPDGSLIVFSSSAGQLDSEIYVVESAGGTPRPLTNNDVTDREPAFSPVANVVAYTSDQDSPGLTEIYSLPLTEDGNIDGGAAPLRITDGSGSNYSPEWSFDGTRLVFVSDRTGSGDIYVVENEIGGPGELVTIDDGDAENRSPSFSPDGLWVAFISNRDSETFQVYLSDLRGLDVRRLTDNGRDDTSVTFQFVDLSAFITETE